jgi:hypothetical protein
MSPATILEDTTTPIVLPMRPPIKQFHSLRRLTRNREVWFS